MGLSDETLRKLEDIITNPFNYCSECGEFCARYSNFCSSCGSKNINFDEAEFLWESEKPLHQAQEEECLVGHPEGKKALQEFPEFPFCDLCGTLLLLPPAPKTKRQIEI